jgi:diadenosine tetraphosphate (Ap4A) HIT family hydrolase
MEISSLNDCELCLAVQDSMFPTEIYNIRLAETKSFIIFSSVGPISLGHVLVVSKRHCSNFSTLSEGEIEDYLALKHRVQQNIPIYQNNLLEFEHGSVNKHSHGGCIVHAHMHWIPELANLKHEITMKLSKIDTIQELSQLLRVNQPYLLLNDTPSRYDIYLATKLPSQYVRRVLAKKLNLQDWDWIIHQKKDIIEETNIIWGKHGAV